MAPENWFLLGAVIVFAVSYVAVAGIRRWALRFGFIDVPNDRSSHVLPIPSGGGVVLVAINVITWIVAARFGSMIFGFPLVSPLHVTVCVAGVLMIAAVSFVDDFGHVPYPIRMFVHVVAATLFVTMYTHWSTLSLPVLGWVTLGSAGVVLSIIWIVGLTNAFNFIDGLDGMAAAQAVVASIGWVALGMATGHSVITGLGLLLGATSLGFLVHNWHPARIFMGDVGSTFLGYSFAILPLIAARYDTRLALSGVLLVWPVVFDSSFTVLRRLRHGQNVFTGHREFLFHRLVAAGWSHRAATMLYAPLPLLGAALAFTWQYGNPFLHTLVVAALVVACGCLWRFVCSVERESERREATASVSVLDGARETSEPAPVPLTWVG